MDLLAHLLSGSSLQAATPSPTDDFWYNPVGTMTAAGMRMTEADARKISAWFRGRDLLATSVAMLPFQLYQRLPDDGGAEPAKQHQLHDILHRKPNPWQDAYGWRRQKMYHLIDFGNSYDRIVPNARGFVGALHPIHPSLVTPEQLDGGRVVYRVRNPKTHQTTTLSQDEVFHLRGASDDGIVGKGILEYARDSLGTALATESYAAKIFSEGTLNSGTIETPAPLGDEQARVMAQSFITAAGKWHWPRIIPSGAKFVPNNLTPEDAQMLLSRKFSIDDIARWLGVPPHMIGSLERSTNNNIEHQGQEFVTYSLGQWLSLFEFGVNDQLIVAVDKYFAEFTRDALVRGDFLTRWQGWHTAVTDGVVTRNEVRQKENWNKLPGLDEPLTPAHIIGKQDAAQEPKPKQPRQPEPEPAEDDDEPKRRQKAEAIAVASAERLLRKEIAAVQKLAVRHAADEDAFVVGVTEFYAKHAELVAQTLQMTEDEAKRYCAGQAHQIVNADWHAALALWQSPNYAAGLAAIALEEAA